MAHEGQLLIRQHLPGAQPGHRQTAGGPAHPTESRGVRL